MTYHVAGIDFSLTNTGVALKRGDRERPVLRNVLSGPVKTGQHPEGGTFATLLDRRNRIRVAVSRIVAEVVTDYDPESDWGVAVIESPLYTGRAGGGGAGQHDRSWGWGLLVDALFARGFIVLEASNSTIKKYATGRGDAPKERMLAVMPRLFPGVFIDDHNIADAAAALAMGCRALGYPLEPSSNRVTPSAIPSTWPRNLRGTEAP